MEFKVKITSPDGKSIEFGDRKETSVIRVVDIKFDTVMKEKQLRKKSKDLQATVEIKGVIQADINQQMKELSDWVRDFKVESTYRRLEVEVLDESAEGTQKMTYILDKMFAVHFDYENRSDEEEAVGMFHLSLMQNGDALSDVVVK